MKATIQATTAARKRVDTTAARKVEKKVEKKVGKKMATAPLSGAVKREGRRVTVWRIRIAKLVR